MDFSGVILEIYGISKVFIVKSVYYRTEIIV